MTFNESKARRAEQDERSEARTTIGGDDENPIETDEDPIEGNAPVPGKRDGASLSDEGIEDMGSGQSTA